MAHYIWILLMLPLARCLLELPIHRPSQRNEGTARLQRRAEKRSIEAEVFYTDEWSAFGGAYYVMIPVGSPPQQQHVLVSTGSSQFWVNTPTSYACNTTLVTAEGCPAGTFESSESSSYQEVAAFPAFRITNEYNTRGPLGTDNITFGNIGLGRVQFGVAENSSAPIGILGLGPSSGQVVDETAEPYPTLPQIMVSENMAASRLFSVALRQNGSGSLIFGGFDTSRYSGDIVTTDLLKYNFQYSSGAVGTFITTVTAATYTAGDSMLPLWSEGSNNTTAYDSLDAAVPVSLDSATATLSLPWQHYTRYIKPLFPYVLENDTCSCDHRNTEDSITFTFADQINITVNIRNFIVPLMDLTSNEPERFENGSESCRFLIVSGAVKGDDEYWTMGTSLLSHMYTVFDLDNNQVSIAQAATEVAEPNIVEVEAGPEGVAKALALFSTSPSLNVPKETAPTPNPGSPSAVNTGAIAGGVVGGLAALGLIGGAAYFLIRRRRKRSQSTGSSATTLYHAGDPEMTNVSVNQSFAGKATGEP